MRKIEHRINNPDIDLNTLLETEFYNEFPVLKNDNDFVVTIWKDRRRRNGLEIFIDKTVHLNISQILDFTWFLKRFANQRLRPLGSKTSYTKEDAAVYADDDGLVIFLKVSKSDEDFDSLEDGSIDWSARAEYERRGDLDLNPDWRGRPPYIKGGE